MRKTINNENLDEKEFIRYKLFEENKSSFKKYSELVSSRSSILALIKYELITTLFAPIPGALGLALRKIFFPFLFKRIGKGVTIGKDFIVRHPEKIYLGKRVIIDDYCLIDARGSGEKGVNIGDDVFIGRGVIIQAKVGSISVGSNTSIGAGSSIISQGGVEIGEMVNIAGNCSISGGSYKVGRDSKSEREHGKHTRGPIYIDRKCRLGMEVMVLDGVHVGEGVILGAKSLITRDLPEYCVAAGIPAEIKYKRDHVSNDNLEK